MKYNFLCHACLIVLLILTACQTRSYQYEGEKLKGVSLVAPPEPMGAEVMEDLESLGVAWVSLMPYAFAKVGDTTLYFNTPRQWWGERDEGLLESIRLAKEKGLHVMLKPHLWLKGGSFTGDLTFASDKEWKIWEQAYTRYILHHARMAETTQVPLLCIGTELTLHQEKRPQYWLELIDTVRSVYKGKLTYAANWDAAESFPHWDRLDYLGVDAYFPLSSNTEPDLAALQKGWRPHLQELQKLAGKYQKPILFTEWGYRSMNGATQEPWRHDSEGTANAVLQSLAYQAFFQTVWQEPWFAGGFLWKWYPTLPTKHYRVETDFTPQGKPAEQVVRNFYKNGK